MPTLSTHVLNSVDGTHAAGVKVQCVGFDAAGSRQVLFEGSTDEGGRLTAELDVPGTGLSNFVLEFHTGAYFAANGLAGDALVRSVQFAVRLQPGDARHHLPVIAGPHGCSAWWSP